MKFLRTKNVAVGVHYDALIEAQCETEFAVVFVAIKKGGVR